MNLHITTSVPEGAHSYFRRDVERLTLLFGAGSQDSVRLVDIHESADVVLFVGSVGRSLKDVRTSSIYRQNPGKCMVVHGGDEPLPTVPGIYASVPRRWFDYRVHRAGFYLRTAVDESISSFVAEQPEYLFSFVGAGTNHPVRKALLQLHSPDAFLLDSSHQPTPAPVARDRFVRSLRESLFVLCPRGGGTSSFRIFETMMAGRVPVIISDEWVEPEGPDWSRFSVRVAERDVTAIPRLLAELQADARWMGENARSAWEQWFGPLSAGPTLLRWISEIRHTARKMESYRLPPALALRVGLEDARAMAVSVRTATTVDVV